MRLFGERRKKRGAAQPAPPTDLAEALIKRLDDPSPSVRHAAAGELRTLRRELLSDKRLVERIGAALAGYSVRKATERNSPPPARPGYKDDDLQGLIAKLKDAIGRDDTNSRDEALTELRTRGQALIERLQDTSAHPTENEGAAFALGWIGDPAAVQPLIEQLLSGTTVDVRAEAAIALGTIGDSAAVEPLALALWDATQKAEVREWSARALGRIGDPAALQPLIEQLQGEDPVMQAAATDALSGFDHFGDWEAVIERIIRTRLPSQVRAFLVGIPAPEKGWFYWEGSASEPEELGARRGREQRAAELLVGSMPDRAAGPLVSVIQEWVPSRGEWATSALDPDYWPKVPSAFAMCGAVANLVEGATGWRLLKPEVPAGVLALRRRVGEALLPLLARWPNDWSHRVDFDRNIVELIGDSGDQTAIPILSEIFLSSGGMSTAANALARLGNEGIRTLIAYVHHEDVFIRKQTVRALLRVDDPAARVALDDLRSTEHDEEVLSLLDE